MFIIILNCSFFVRLCNDMRAGVSSWHSVHNRAVKRVWCSRQAGGLTTFSLILLLLLMTFSSAPIRPSRLFMPEPTEGTANQSHSCIQIKLKRLPTSLWSTVAAIKTITSIFSRFMARNLLPRQIAQSVRGRHTNTDSFISHALITVYDVEAPTEPRVLLDQPRHAQCKHSAHSKRCDLLWSKGLFLEELVPWDILWALVSSNGSINRQSPYILNT